jgi:hypothetical protein
MTSSTKMRDHQTTRGIICYQLSLSLDSRPLDLYIQGQNPASIASAQQYYLLPYHDAMNYPMRIILRDILDL